MVSSYKISLPCKFVLVIFSLFLTSNHLNEYIILVQAAAPGPQPIVDGLSWHFHDTDCPNLESLIREHLTAVLWQDIGQTAGFLHLYLQDCLSQGCDASILFGGPSPRLRTEVLMTISELGKIVRKECGRVVSCADIITIATRDAVYLGGGPDYAVPLGRRDSLAVETIKETPQLPFPSPASDTSTVLKYFEQLNFNATDVVAISGAHTVGLSVCAAFRSRLYPELDPTMDQRYGKHLRQICGDSSTTKAVMDIRSPNLFDNRYFVNLKNRQGLLTTDQDLYNDGRTRGIVNSFAKNQSLFFEKFADAIVKMGQLGVLTGNQGEIREDCTAPDLANVASVTHEFGVSSS